MNDSYSAAAQRLMHAEAKVTTSPLLLALGVALSLGGLLTPCARAERSRREPATPGPSTALALRYLGTSVLRPVVTDGKRHAAYLVTERTARVLEEQGRPLRDVELPPEPLTLPRTIEAVGGGYVLVGDAAHGAPRPTLIEIATGKVVDVDARPWWELWDNWQLMGVGRQWLGADGVSSHGGADTFLNWHTGRVATDYRLEPRNTARAVPDLNVVSLWRRMCSPLRRRSSFDPEIGDGRGVWRSYQYRPPFGLTTSRAGRLLLERCGRRGAIVLSRCRRGCGGAQLGAGIVTWSERRRAYLYRARAKCKRSWLIPGPRSHLRALSRTRRRVFVSTIDPASYGKLEPRPVWTIYTAALPSC